MMPVATTGDGGTAVSGASLFSRLFRTSLLVSAIGLVGIALLLVLNWRQGRTTLYMANVQAPLALSANSLMLGISASQYNLNSWVTLGEARFRQAWEGSWQDQIQPALDDLQAAGSGETFAGDIDSLRYELRALKEAQWWVQEFAGSAGNDRANALLDREILPILDSLQQHLGSLAALSDRTRAANAANQHNRINELRSDLRLFGSWLHEAGTHREKHLLQDLARQQAQISDAIENLGRFPAGTLPSELADAARRDWKAIATLSEYFMEEVARPDSNAARVLMRTRTVPQGDAIMARASGLVEGVRQRFLTETERLTRSAWELAFIALGVLILIGVASGLVSLWLSRRLAQPVVALSAAVSGFRQGEHEAALPLPDTRELAVLTQQFNEMRGNLHGLLTDLSNTNKELEQFAYTVSHDLRAPLRAIDGFSRALVEDYGDQLEGEAREYLDLLSKGAQDMGRLIDDILWLSRSTRGEMKMESVNISDLAEEIIAGLRRAEPQRLVETRIEPDIRVLGDQRLLKNLLSNLLDNAWKFTARAEPARISLSAEDRGERISVVLEDNGVGFDMKYADKLFKPFHRLHGDGDFPGTGIGLSSVLRIVNRHRGHIEAWGEPGRGARMTMEFNKGKECEIIEERVTG